MCLGLFFLQLYGQFCSPHHNLITSRHTPGNGYWNAFGNTVLNPLLSLLSRSVHTLHLIKMSWVGFGRLVVNASTQRQCAHGDPGSIPILSGPLPVLFPCLLLKSSCTMSSKSYEAIPKIKLKKWIRGEWIFVWKCPGYPPCIRNRVVTVCNKFDILHIIHGYILDILRHVRIAVWPVWCTNNSCGNNSLKEYIHHQKYIFWYLYCIINSLRVPNF